MCICRACTKKKSFVDCICGIRVKGEREEERQRERDRKERRKVNMLQPPTEKNFYKEECKPHLWNDDVSESKIERWS
jgi:hypothetical protein